MAVPELKIELSVGASDGPYTVSPTWADITGDVRELSLRRGRADDFEQNFRSSANLVIENKDRKYDPFNASGTFYGKLTPRKQIRITAIVNSVEYPMFRGVVNGFPVSWTKAGKESTINVEAFDFLSLLAVQQLKSDFADIYTRELAPKHYYKCNEPSDTTTVKDYGSEGFDLTYEPIDTALPKKPLQYVPLGLGLKNNALNIEYAWFNNTRVRTPTVGNLTAAMWTAGTGKTELRNLFAVQGNNGHEIFGDVSNPTYGSGNTKIQLWYNNGTTTNYRQSTLSGFNSVVPNHVCFTYDATSGVGKIYVNGEDVTDTTVGANQSGLSFFPCNYVQFYGGITQEVAIFDKVLTSTEIRNLYQFGQGSQTETTAERMDRLAALTDLDSSFFDINYTASTTLAGIPDFQQNILDAMLTTQRTEGGYLFVNKSGDIVATSRDYTWTTSSISSVQMHFSDDPADTGAYEYGGDIELWVDGDNLRNDITVNYSFGAPVNAVNTTSKDANGRHTETIDALNSTFVEANDLAYHYLNFYSLSVPTLSPIEVGLQANTNAEWEALLGLELMDKIKFTRTPASGSQYETDLIINSFDFDIKPKIWKLRLSGSSRFTYRPPTITNLSFASVTSTTATVSATVNANKSSTAVTFEYSTSSTFSSVTSVSATPSTVTGETGTSCSASLSGLSPATTYYYRCKAVNAIGTVYSSGSFTTWGLKTVTFTGTGTWSPASGVSVSSISSVVAVGGGGGATDWAGGGGGQVSQSASMAMSSSVSVTIGAGGLANTSNGGTTTVAASTNLTAVGGNKASGTTGGSSGSGNAGGTSAGGGGGQGGVGGNGSYSAIGGDGGAGVTINGVKLAGGGSGAGTANGSGSTYGSDYGQGGVGYSTGFINFATDGQAGWAQFKYYGPSGSRSGTGWTEA